VCVPSSSRASVYAERMVWVYAFVLVAGVLMALAWLVAVAVGAWVEGWEFADPERRFGPNGRSVVAGFVGFGMAGMSATFAGWHPILALIAAVLGAAALVVVSRAFAPAEV
jgi:hypothetical protein